MMAIGLLVLLVLMVSKVDADDVSYLQKETTALKLKIGKTEYNNDINMLG